MSFCFPKRHQQPEICLSSVFFYQDTLPNDSLPASVVIKRTWMLPAPLKNISGFDFIDASRIACIQDEAGTIYVFNLKSKKIERKIPFAPPGDYEAIAVAGASAFVACADGRLYEVAEFLSKEPSVKEYGTHLTVRQNVEGLTYDPSQKRLLVAIKGAEEGSVNYKGIYEFDLNTRKMPVKPFIKIDLLDSVLNNKSNSRNLQSLLQPSDIELNTANNKLYLVDAERPQLIEVDGSGKVLKVFSFPRGIQIQPEGIRFTPSGELYISSEGFREEPGKLLLIALPST